MALYPFKIHIHFLRPFGCINYCTVLIALHFPLNEISLSRKGQLKMLNSNLIGTVVQGFLLFKLQNKFCALSEFIQFKVWYVLFDYSSWHVFSKIFRYFLKMTFQILYLMWNFVKVLTANFKLISILQFQYQSILTIEFFIKFEKFDYSN